MKKTSSKTQYVIVGNTENVERICSIQTSKDGTRIIKICNVQHEELDGWHYHCFLLQSVSVNYCGMEYDGVVEFYDVKKFTLDGKDIEPSLNRELTDMISYRRGTDWTEGMSQFLREIENDVKEDEQKTENDVKEDEQKTENDVKETGQKTENDVKEDEQKTGKVEKPAKWVLSKAVKVDTFNRMCEKAWAESGLKDESIRRKVYDELAEWYKLDSRSPLAGYSSFYLPHSQEELEKQMYDSFDTQFYQYNH